MKLIVCIENISSDMAEKLDNIFDEIVELTITTDAVDVKAEGYHAYHSVHLNDNVPTYTDLTEPEHFSDDAKYYCDDCGSRNVTVLIPARFYVSKASQYRYAQEHSTNVVLGWHCEECGNCGSGEPPTLV